MPIKQLEARVRHQAGVAVVEMHGEIDAFAEAALNAAYGEAISRDPKIVLLDFDDVPYINSTGIALIVSLLVEARKSGRRLLTCGLKPHYVEIFEITRLAHYMSIFPDEASALASAGSRK